MASVVVVAFGASVGYFDSLGGIVRCSFEASVVVVVVGYSDSSWEDIVHCSSVVVALVFDSLRSLQGIACWAFVVVVLVVEIDSRIHLWKEKGKQKKNYRRDCE